jgi:hypothetical protein
LKRSAFEHRLKVVLRDTMKQQNVSQSLLVHLWHSHPEYTHEPRNVVRDMVWRLLHPHYPVGLHHFEFALKLMNCDVQLSIVPRIYEPKEQGKSRKEA